jgi:hypothetical protein
VIALKTNLARSMEIESQRNRLSHYQQIHFESSSSPLNQIREWLSSTMQNNEYHMQYTIPELYHNVFGLHMIPIMISDLSVKIAHQYHHAKKQDEVIILFFDVIVLMNL